MNMKNLKKQRVVILTLLFILLFSVSVFAEIGLVGEDQTYEEYNIEEKEHINKIINDDSINSKSKLNQEIKQIEEKLEEIINNGYTTTRSNVKIYDPKATLDISTCKLAIYNRNNAIKSKDFKYRDDLFFDLYSNAADNIILCEIENDFYKNITEETEKIVNTMYIDNNFLSGTIIQISPFNLRDVNGYAYRFRDIIVVANGGSLKGYTSTLLHEIGHTVWNQVERLTKKPFIDQYKEFYNFKSLEENKGKDYNSYEESIEWEEHPAESFAEDFKIYISNRGRIKYNVIDKRTNYPFNKDVINFIEGLVNTN